LSSRSYIAALAAGVLACAASAADYPSRPIRFIVPSAAGGAPDYLVRALTQELAGVLNQQVVVDNRAGASGVIGVELIARAPADGYTIGYGNAPLLAILPSLNPKLPYDVARDLQPIARYNFSQNILAVRTSLPVTSVKELIDYAKKNPGRLSYASPGNGTTVHLSAELFKQMTGTNMLHVPYKSIAQALTELIAGQVDLVFDNLTSTAPHVKAGRLRGIAVTGPARTPILPDLPTVAEAGVPGYEVTTWGGFIAPAHLPRPILTRLTTDINKACAMQSVKDRLAAVGNQCVGGSPQEFAEFVGKERVKWADVVKKAGAKIDG
jgi:tripartite-type tricarboxylate transporter receptor subunit TctC